jgi:hypothetical protein
MFGRYRVQIFAQTATILRSAAGLYLLFRGTVHSDSVIRVDSATLRTSRGALLM